MCHTAAAIRIQRNGAVMSSVQCYVCLKPARLCHHLCVCVCVCVCWSRCLCCICFFSPCQVTSFCGSFSCLPRCPFLSRSKCDIPMVYPVGKVPRRRTVNDVGWDHGTAGDWNREEAPCTAVAADSEARWQDVSAKGGSLVLSPRLNLSKVLNDQRAALVHIVGL